MELQQASQIANQKGQDNLIQTLESYLTVFTDLDSEFEKYFNEFDSFGRLQRLLEKDPNEILGSFSDLVERNLRVDYNVKSSFIPQFVQPRLHSF
jgi:Kelch motif/Galactose oxidase, central domain